MSPRSFPLPIHPATAISGSEAKATPVDADLVGLVDSAASGIFKKLTWENVKATLKTYFDTLYGPITSQQIVFVSSPSEDASAALGVLEFVASEAMSVIAIEFRCDSDNPPTGSAAQLDVLLNGTTVFSTNPTIDANEFSSTTAATPAALSSNPTAVAAGAKLEFDLDQVGAANSGWGYYAIIYYSRSNS